jgi:hypothetical protein
MQHGTETEMVSVTAVQQEISRTSLSDVAQILQNKLSHSEAQTRQRRIFFQVYEQSRKPKKSILDVP